MNKSTELKLAITSALLLGTMGAFCKDEIKTYSIPKSRPSIQKPMAAQGGVDVNASPVQWTTPKDWQELPPTSIRLGNFVIPGKDGKKADVTITSFPGSVGGELSNVNRWRGELGLPAVQEGEISSQSVDVGAAKAKLYDFNADQSRTVVASLPRAGATWFFKMRGDKEVVTLATETFLEFLKSIRFEAKAGATAHGPGDGHNHGDAATDPHTGLADIPADPHAGIPGAPPLNTPVAAAAEGNSEEPKWQVPSNWKAKKPGMMILKSFSVLNDGKEATVSISVFPGDVGGTFGNVNRWRGQMGLPPITPDELPQSITTIAVEDGGKATAVDLKGTDAKSGNAARMVALAVPHGDSTWFYKLVGEETVIAHEKESFIKFVQTVRYK
ncbi:MAG: hypothetical protein JWM68_5425 [Verrucomicrobiales bacterium]|nr:hypothetical protein [Verrucomicrobiales bacterium]